MAEIKRSAILEIRAYMTEHNMTRQQATTALFQPDRGNTSTESTSSTHIFKDFVTDDCLFDTVVTAALEHYRAQREQVTANPLRQTTGVKREFLLSTDAFDDVQLLSFSNEVMVESR